VLRPAARMAISSLGFPLGSAIGGALIGAMGVLALILAVAGAFLALASLPLLVSGLRAGPGAWLARHRPIDGRIRR